MALQFKRAARSAVYLKLAITGPSGSGKTTAALKLARGLVGPTGRIAVLDTENGSASLYADLTDFDVLDLEAPYEPGQFVEAISAAFDAGYDCIIVDSFSHVWEAVLAYKEKLDARGGNGYTNWGAAGAKYKAVLDAILQGKAHVICCLRAKTDYVIEEANGKKQVRKVGLAPVARDGTEFEFTLVLDLDASHNAAASKDRTRLFDGRIAPITEQTGRTLAAWREGIETAPTPVEPKPVPAPAPATVAQPAEPSLLAPEQLSKLRLYAQNGVASGVIERALAHYGNPLDCLTPQQADLIIRRCQEEMNRASETKAPAPAPKREKPTETTPAEVRFPWPASMAQWLGDNEEAVNAAMVQWKWIKPGQTWRDLGPDEAEKVAANPTKLARALNLAKPAAA